MKALALSAALVLSATAHASAWEPTKPVEVVVPFGPGGASDQMARTIQGIVQKHNLSSQQLVVVNKPAATGGEAMMDIQKSMRDPHKLLTTSSGIYMTPLSTKIPVNWRNFTPVGMLAQDEFLVWVKNDASYKTVQDLLAEAKTASPAMKIGGGGSKREDDLIVFSIGAEAGVKLTYIPYKSGGEASTQLAGGHVSADTNNPSEDVANWRGGQTRPLCVLSKKRIAYTARSRATRPGDIPDCGEQGLNFTYNMLRGIFMPGGVTEEQKAFYVNLLKKVSETPEWKEYLERNALLPDQRFGEDFEDFLLSDEALHKDLMGKAGFLATN
ncbi:Bug family tripartite tricarboxylate transporter substrate binding protein [Chenggangzhangella methanolivorans]|uniref:Tripartite tricarboxylate transporter substrate binding protein n=1 Tax=Chenggangzhangella methanolivorans TaxID=1437009 RepID=A0A9E6UM07_9HYPH|nr:tripartite tricarboxylate transporter substrate-binding protein [Chenggangzhangella methanolivorans]QZO01157.1 tripartite tricarboxylate transporter substrate binding protein [Chenggangzhangella methanolivorans]